MLYKLRYDSYKKEFNIEKLDFYIEKEKSFVYKGSRVIKVDLLKVRMLDNVYFVDGDIEKAKEVLMNNLEQKADKKIKSYNEVIEMIDKLKGV